MKLINIKTNVKVKHGGISAIKSRAEGQRTARIEQAKGEIAVFDKLYTEYKNNQEITRQRLVIETLESVLPNAQIYIMNDSGETVKYLPLQQPTQVPPVATEGGGN
jgi:membrane protease subunit HflK